MRRNKAGSRELQGVGRKEQEKQGRENCAEEAKRGMISRGNRIKSEQYRQKANNMRKRRRNKQSRGQKDKTAMNRLDKSR